MKTTAKKTNININKYKIPRFAGYFIFIIIGNELKNNLGVKDYVGEIEYKNNVISTPRIKNI